MRIDDELVSRSALISRDARTHRERAFLRRKLPSVRPVIGLPILQPE
jgi:hypothetical protein